jgi:integrase
VDALTCFSRFLTLAGVDALAEVGRPLLERYLAHVASLPGGRGMKKTRIGALNVFFQNIRQHRWDDTLPGTAAFYPGDIPPVPEQADRRLAGYVMAQVEAPAHLDRWPSPAGRLITLILARCGLRISSALALGFDCLLRDGQGAPYLRYFNTKMRREAAVPIDEELEAAVGDQQRRVLSRWPDGTTCLFPRERANVSGNLPLADGTYRRMLGRWLATCEIRDEHGRPVHLTPHQWRHTSACRLINRDVRQEVVRVLLDHDSHKMTSHYARSPTRRRGGTGSRPPRSTSTASASPSTPAARSARPSGPRPDTAWPPRPCPTATAACPSRRAARTPTRA